jgi:hypothetical protein
MNTEITGLGACDRCRGQKLRCTGAANPIPSPDSRYQRNQTPCARCRRAKVECFSVKPAPRRPAVSGVRSDNAQQSLPPITHHQQHEADQERAIVDRQQKDRADVLPDSCAQESNAVILQPLHSMSDEWIMPFTNDGLACNDHGTATPSWALGSVTMMDNLGDHDMTDLTSRDDHVAWTSDMFDGQQATTQEGIGHLDSPVTQRHGRSQIDHEQDTLQKHPQPSRSTNRCIQDIARLNERLLVEKSGLEHTSPNNDTPLIQPSIGQILRYAQDFVSILQRLESWGSTLDSISHDDARSADCSDFERQCNESRSSTQHRGSLSSSRRSIAPPSSTAPYLDIPALLSMLSCYACILEFFESVFTPIHNAITNPVPTVPATLTELSLDGFDLDDRNALQLECLISVSLRLLKRIEDILIGSPEHEGVSGLARGDALAQKIFAGFLDALYVQYEQDTVLASRGKRMVRAETLVRDIQSALQATEL